MNLTVVLVVVACAAVVVAAMLCLALFRARVRIAEAEVRSRSQEEIGRAKANELAAQRESLKSEFAKLASDLLVAKQGALTQANETSVRSL